MGREDGGGIRIKKLKSLMAIAVRAFVSWSTTLIQFKKMKMQHLLFSLFISIIIYDSFVLSVFAKRYSVSSSLGSDGQCQQTSDKGYNNAATITVNGSYEVCLIKTDSMGNVLLKKNY